MLIAKRVRSISWPAWQRHFKAGRQVARQSPGNKPRGSVARVKRLRPAFTTMRFSAALAGPGCHRQFAGNVAVRANGNRAGYVDRNRARSTTCRSRSVAISRTVPLPAARSARSRGSTVLRRSTTD